MDLKKKLCMRKMPKKKFMQSPKKFFHTKWLKKVHQQNDLPPPFPVLLHFSGGAFLGASALALQRSWSIGISLSTDFFFQAIHCMLQLNCEY